MNTRLASTCWLALSTCLAATGALVVGCDGDPAVPDAALLDAGPADAGPRDTGVPDARVEVDAGPVTCTPDAVGPVESVFVLPRDGTEPFFDLPWPNDLRRTPEGTVDASAFPNPRSNGFVRRYLDAITARLDGFGTNGAVYFRFSRPVSDAGLPASPEASIADGASVFLVDVDPASPDVGARHPAVVHYQDCPTRYWAAHTLAIRPVYGVPLAGARRYAAVVTRDVLPRDGGAFARDEDFEALLGADGDAAVVDARALYGDVFDVLADAGVTRDSLLALTVFTTQDAISETLGIRDWMVSSYPAPTVTDGSLAVQTVSPRFTEIVGTYGPVPVFQDGAVPFAESGGEIVVDDAGAPTVHSEYAARFALAVPESEMPADGYPVVLYAHGTGGDYRSFMGNGAGEALARLGFATMGVDQIHHGARNPTPDTDPALLFFNIPNPQAARDNNRQSALDIVQQARLVANLTAPVDFLDRDGAALRLDPNRIYFMGHSQGGLNGPIYLAIDDSARGAVLSAASAVITPALIEKLEPLAIPDVVKALLTLPGGTWQEAYRLEGFTVEHPIATLLSMWLEASDSSNYAHLIFESPRAGFAPKSALMTEGMLDPYSPPASIEALAGAMFVPQVDPVRRIAALVVRGVSSTSSPATANVAGGAATAGILQFPSDGHFAIFDNPTAEAQVYGFFESLEGGGPGTIPAP